MGFNFHWEGHWDASSVPLGLFIRAMWKLNTTMMIVVVDEVFVDTLLTAVLDLWASCSGQLMGTCEVVGILWPALLQLWASCG
jgi:hypothetical protein